MTTLPPCNTCGGIEYHWARYTHARIAAGAAPSGGALGFAFREARRFYEAHAADPRWVPDEFDRDAMQWLDVDAPLRVPVRTDPGPGSIQDARRVAGQTHDGHHPGQPCCAPLLNVGDRVRIGDDPFWIKPGGAEASDGIGHLSGTEGTVREGPDGFGDCKVRIANGVWWINGSCLTKIEKAET